MNRNSVLYVRSWENYCHGQSRRKTWPNSGSSDHFTSVTYKRLSNSRSNDIERSFKNTALMIYIWLVRHGYSLIPKNLRSCLERFSLHWLRKLYTNRSNGKCRNLFPPLFASWLRNVTLFILSVVYMGFSYYTCKQPSLHNKTVLIFRHPRLQSLFNRRGSYGANLDELHFLRYPGPTASSKGVTP